MHLRLHVFGIKLERDIMSRDFTYLKQGFSHTHTSPVWVCMSLMGHEIGSTMEEV